MTREEIELWIKTLPEPTVDATGWIHIDDKKPEIDQDIIYFFDVLGMYLGKYDCSPMDIAIFGEDSNGNPWMCDSFHSKHGWLSGGEVTHWRPVEITDE